LPVTFTSKFSELSIHLRFLNGPATSESTCSGAFGHIIFIPTSPGEISLCMKRVDFKKCQITEEEATNEAKNWKLLNHPNIVKIVSWQIENQFLCIIMERVDGFTLQTLLDNHRKHKQQLKEKMILQIFTQLISALKHCHSKKIIHRDLKPENIMIARDQNNVKLIDFGFSKHLVTPFDLASTYCGTLTYMAPEIIKNEQYSFPADVWSVGVILFELLTLQYPFDSSSLLNLDNSIVSGNIPPTERKCKLK
jgi:serine/threonine protein kinase